jgi:hypothetical protein
VLRGARRYGWREAALLGCGWCRARQRSHSKSMPVHLVCARFLVRSGSVCAAREGEPVVAVQEVVQRFCEGFQRPVVVPARIGSRKVAASACAVSRLAGSPTSAAALV